MAGSQREVSSGFKPNDYYDPDIQTVNEPIRSILEKYSKVPGDRIVDHVNDVVSLYRLGIFIKKLRLYMLTAQ